MALLEILEHHDPTGEEIVYRFPPEGSADIKLARNGENGNVIMLGTFNLHGIALRDEKTFSVP